MPMANLTSSQKFLKSVGLGKEDYYFWKQIGKALFCTRTVFGLSWLYNEILPLGWTLKPQPKEEKQMAHLYERRKFPYPVNAEAVEEFVASEGTIGTTIGTKVLHTQIRMRTVYRSKVKPKNLIRWLHTRNEVIDELQEKGFDVE